MNQQLLLLIAQLLQLAIAEIPNAVKIISTLQDGTSNFESFLTDADKVELAEIEKLKGQLT